MASGDPAITENDLWEFVDAATNRRRHATGTTADDSPYGPLLGYCFSNSYVLHTLLDENGIDSRVVGGARAYDLPNEDEDSDYHPETAEELSYGTPLHFWVEVETDGDPWVIELATEERPHRGPPAVNRGVPDDFVRYPDSYDYAEELIDEYEKTAESCPYCGGIPEWDDGADLDKTCPGCGREFEVEEGAA